MHTGLSLRASALVPLLLSAWSSTVLAADHERDCERWPTQTRELQETLGRQVIAAANFASSQSGAAASKLDTLVARDAAFEMGASDVGRSFGKGPSGLRSLMRELQAERYRFDGWDAMSRSELPCGPHEVTVEFSSVKLGERAELKFSFDGGKIVAGKGWQETMTAGSFPAR